MSISILSQLAITQAQALAGSTVGRVDFFVDSLDGKLKAYDATNTLEEIGGASTAQEVAYTLTVPTDWDGTPANAQAALDELASRVKGIEGKTDFITVTAAIDLDDVKSKANSALQSGANHSALTLNDGTNPHGTTKTDVGLANVDNTSDLNKPVSNATQTALNAKKDDFTENTAFNKNFGTASGDVLEGDTRTINSAEITKLSNTSGTNTGDETTTSIQTKRPIKTVNGVTLEGTGNIPIDGGQTWYKQQAVNTIGGTVNAAFGSPVECVPFSGNFEITVAETGIYVIYGVITTLANLNKDNGSLELAYGIDTGGGASIGPQPYRENMNAKKNRRNGIQGTWGNVSLTAGDKVHLFLSTLGDSTTWDSGEIFIQTWK